MTNTSPWYLAEKAGADGLSLLRLLDVGPAFRFRKHPEKFSVIWSYEEKDSSGPSDDESLKMEEFENAVCSAMEAAHEAVLVVVFTEPTRREFVWHARGKSSFLKTLNQSRRGS